MIEFIMTNEVATVPVTWITESQGETWWPPYKTNDRIFKAVKIKENVNQRTWTKHSIRVIKLYRKSDINLILLQIYLIKIISS